MLLLWFDCILRYRNISIAYLCMKCVKEIMKSMLRWLLKPTHDQFSCSFLNPCKVLMMGLEMWDLSFSHKCPVSCGYNIYLWWIVASIERTCIRDHFKDHATKCPEIDTLSMALPLDDFRCHIVGCATHGKGAAVVDALGKSHVNQLWVPILTDQRVFRFQVTVCNSFAVHVLQSANHQN